MTHEGDQDVSDWSPGGDMTFPRTTYLSLTTWLRKVHSWELKANQMADVPVERPTANNYQILTLKPTLLDL